MAESTDFAPYSPCRRIRSFAGIAVSDLSTFDSLYGSRVVITMIGGVEPSLNGTDGRNIVTRSIESIGTPICCSMSPSTLSNLASASRIGLYGSVFFSSVTFRVTNANEVEGTRSTPDGRAGC